MDLWDYSDVLRKRWIVVLSVLAATAVALVGVLYLTPSRYQSSAQVLFLSPSTKDDPNPYLSFGPSLSVTADVVSRTLSSESYANELSAAGQSAEYEVGASFDGAQQIINVITTDEDPATTQETMDALVAGTSEVLVQIQDESSVPEQYRIQTRPLSASVEPTVMRGTQMRLGVAVAVLGLILAVVSALVANSWSRRRAERKRDGGNRPVGSGSAQVAAPLPAPGQSVRSADVPEARTGDSERQLVENAR